MKTIISMLFMLFSLVGLQAVFAQNGKSVSFQIGNIPTKQGKILLSTEDGKYGMADVTASVVTITLTDLSYGEHTVSVFHDANGNYKLDRANDNMPIEYCAIQKIEVTEENQLFKIELVDVRETKSKSK